MKKLDFLLAVVSGIGLLLGLWFFSDFLEGEDLPFLFMGIYLAALVFLSRKLSSKDAMLFSLIAQLTVFVGYKTISIYNVIQDYRADGFLGDYEVGPYKTLDLFVLVFLIGTFLMTAIARFALARKKFRQIPRGTLKMIGLSLVVLLTVGILNSFSWNVTNPYTQKLDTYCTTFTPEKWAEYAPKRQLMLADFLAGHKGASEQEVLELLGEPESEDGYFAGYGGQGEMYVSFEYDEAGGLKDEANFVSKSPYINQTF